MTPTTEPPPPVLVLPFPAAVLTCGDAITAQRSPAAPTPAPPLVVGIDGVDCAGKSTLAAAVAAALPGPLATIHFDDDVRLSDEEVTALPGPGEFIDLFSPELLRERVARAMATSGDDVPPPSVLRPVILVEGLFLFQAALDPIFDMRIRLEISESTVIGRALRRDVTRFGSADIVMAHYRAHCLPAQRVYRSLCRPAQRADLVIDAEGW